MQVTIIGSGNVAAWLAYSLYAAKIQISQIYSRDINKSQILAAQYNAEPICSLSQLKPDNDIYIFSLKDDAYISVLKEIHFSMPIALHTGGSVSQTIFAEKALHYGVLYPYQSINKSTDFSTIVVPLCIEAESEETLQLIEELAQKLSEQVYKITELQRAYLHLAAVFASNFTNMLYGIGYEILTANGIDTSIIYPLLHHTLEQIQTISPLKAQTGPAIRFDQSTIEKQISLIDNQELTHIYKMMTYYIQTHINKN